MHCHRWLLILLVFFCFCFQQGHAQNLETISAQKPFTLSGSVNVRGMFYNVKGIPARRKPFSYFISGNPTAHIYGVTVPVYFTFSEQDRRIRQPFNQLGMSPYYKWVTVHVGYRNITWSPFTMAGHTILGAGVELTPGIFRFGFIYGRLNRATSVDTTSGSLQPFTYTRKGYATRIGVGNQKNFLDLSLVKAKDDSASIGKDVLKTNAVKPAENAVLGISGKLTFLKNFFIDADGAISLYTRNLQSSINFDSLMPKTLSNSLGRFIAINGSSEFYSAYQTSFGYKSRIFGLKIQYKRIDSDFKSMGAYFFNNDLENITIAPSMSLFESRFRFSGSIGIQRDNLQNQKESTSRRVIGSANLSADFTDRLGLDANYTNYSNNQRPGAVVVADSFLIAQTTQNLSVSPRYFITGTEKTHVFLLSVNYMTLNDLNPTTEAYSEIKSNNVFFNYQITFIPKGLTFTINLNSTRMKFSSGDDGNQGITLGISKSFDGNKVMVSLNNSYYKGLRNSATSRIINSGLLFNYKPHPKHQFNFLAYLIGNYPTGNETNYNKKFTETRGEIGYTFNF